MSEKKKTKNAVIKIRVNEDEKKYLSDLAEIHGVSVSELIRIALDSLPKTLPNL